jgi:hypothetical protein
MVLLCLVTMAVKFGFMLIFIFNLSCVWEELEMADDANLQLESALSTLLSITEKSGNLRRDR